MLAAIFFVSDIRESKIDPICNEEIHKKVFSKLFEMNLFQYSAGKNFSVVILF